MYPPVWIWRYTCSVYTNCLIHYVTVTTERFHLFTPFHCIPFVVVPHYLLQITFLEFFEVLLGSAEVKCPQVSEALEGGQTRSSLDSEARRNLPDVAVSGKILQTSNSWPP